MRPHEIINLILNIWFFTISLIIVFFIGEAFVTKKPNTKFGKWWRKHVADFNDERVDKF